jgi:hypothetical protein
MIGTVATAENEGNPDARGGVGRWRDDGRFASRRAARAEQRAVDLRSPLNASHAADPHSATRSCASTGCLLP